MFAFIATLASGCAITGMYMGWYCVGNENRDPALADNEVCDLLGSYLSLQWWIAVLWPAVLFLATQLSSPLQRRRRFVGAIVVVLAIAFWTAIGFAVVDV